MLLTDYEYFLFYLHYKIDDGQKQVTIAKSNKVNLSTAYINKLYKNPPKACSQDIQNRIADFFGLTYEDLIEESKKLYRAHSQIENLPDNSLIPSSGSSLSSKKKVKEPQPPEKESEELRNPLILIDQLISVSNNIRQIHNASKKVEEERDDLLSMLTYIRSGICIADEDLQVSFQNHEHKRMFGNKINKPYNFFWQKNFGSNELTEKLFSEDYNGRIVTYNKRAYLVHVVATIKRNSIRRVFEQVVCLNEQDASYYHSLSKQDKQISIYSCIFKYMDHGFGFFNNDRVLEIASNKFGLIDPKYNFPETKPTLDQLLLDMGEKMKGGIKIVTTLKNAYEARKEINIEVAINGNSYDFQTVNIVEDNQSQGILLIVRKK